MNIKIQFPKIDENLGSKNNISDLILKMSNLQYFLLQIDNCFWLNISK